MSSATSSPLRILVIGAHGRVASCFLRQSVARGHTLFAQVRQPQHASDLPIGTRADQVTPIVMSLEEANVDRLAGIFDSHDPHVVLFAAGAGGKGGPERTKAVDEEGAIKVFDALERSKKTSFRRFMMCSAIDCRDVEKTKPDWYGEEDFQTSAKMRQILGPYMAAKHAADLNLSKRNQFPWFVLRPSSLSDDGPSGRVSLGERKTITRSVPRGDVADVFLKVAELPKGQADGLMLDLTGGDVAVEEAVQKAVQRGRTDWLG